MLNSPVASSLPHPKTDRGKNQLLGEKEWGRGSFVELEMRQRREKKEKVTEEGMLDKDLRHK